jgi:flagellar hook-basal body protein
LQNNSGFPVLGTSGPIAIPPNTAKITITENGTVLADRKPVGQIQLAKFADPQALAPAGDTLFAAPASAQPQAGTSKIQQGYREGSNVQPANEMVAMISGMRQYEAAQRALRTLSDAMHESTRPQGS